MNKYYVGTTEIAKPVNHGHPDWRWALLWEQAGFEEIDMDRYTITGIDERLEVLRKDWREATPNRKKVIELIAKGLKERRAKLEQDITI